MTDWNPEHDLAALLDALTAELLTAADHEVTPYLREPGDDDGAQLVRRLIAAADADFAVLPVSRFTTPGLRAYMTRNQ